MDEEAHPAGGQQDRALGQGKVLLALPAGAQPDVAVRRIRGERVQLLPEKVDSRMARRSVLDAPGGPQFIGVIDEAALRREAGSAEVMAEQLRFLQGMAAHYKVTLLVVPFDAGAHMAMEGPFALLDFPRPEPSIVTLSNGVEPLYVEDEAYVDRHTLIFEGVHNLALDPKKSLGLIESIAADHDKRA